MWIKIKKIFSPPIFFRSQPAKNRCRNKAQWQLNKENPERGSEMYHNRYLEEMRKTCRETGSMNWFRLQSTKYETVRETEENEYKDEIFADVDPGINWY